jgi:hypothetical protein
METKLVRIAQIAKVKPKEVFTSLYHHLNEEMLTQAHQELKGDKAVGMNLPRFTGHQVKSYN